MWKVSQTRFGATAKKFGDILPRIQNLHVDYCTPEKHDEIKDVCENLFQAMKGASYLMRKSNRFMKNGDADDLDHQPTNLTLGT